MELDLRSLFGLLCTAVLIGIVLLPPFPRIWARIRGRYWSAKIDDISLLPPGYWSEMILSYQLKLLEIHIVETESKACVSQQDIKNRSQDKTYAQYQRKLCFSQSNCKKLGPL